MKKHNTLVTVNGVSKSRAQWAKELGVTKGAISLRESKGESASSAIGKIIGTIHSRKVLEHYAHAREKHPYFCDLLLPPSSEWTKENAHGYLNEFRNSITAQMQTHRLLWSELCNCEIAEAEDALINGDTANAVEECYDAISVLLRVIDVLEGRQKLGRDIPNEHKNN